MNAEMLCGTVAPVCATLRRGKPGRAFKHFPAEGGWATPGVDAQKTPSQPIGF